jgi:hypothetical protein
MTSRARKHAQELRESDGVIHQGNLSRNRPDASGGTGDGLPPSLSASN